MKKVLKSRLFVAIITAIICVTGTAYATTQILASNIAYKDTTVEAALNDLYSNRYNFDNTISIFNVSNGTNVKRNSSINVSQGTYLVLANIEQGGSSSSSSASKNLDCEIDLKYNKGNCKRLTGKQIYSAATSQFISQYLWNNMWYSLFICNITEQDTLSITNFQTGTFTETISSVSLDAIKIR